MELLFATLIFLIGLGVLITGAEIFIHHSAQLGAKLGISDVVVGITLVALGTSIPEIFVSISSIINDAPALALGNSIGSNISNIAIIYGLSLFWLSSKTLNISLRNIFILILSVLIAGWALYDLTITVADSVVFMIAIGTSLPELAASISALRRNKGNMVVGNIVGSNILNVVLIFPIIGIGSTAIFDQEIFSRDFMVMSIFSAAFILLISIGRQDLDIKKVLYPVFGIGMFISIAFYLTSLF